MQKIQRSKDELTSILKDAKQMAQKYGRIGIEDPDDISQNVMLRVLNRTDQREIGTFWLLKTVRSAAMDAGRKHSRQARWMCAVDDENIESVCERTDDNGYLHTGDSDTMSLDDVEPDLIPRLKNVLKELTKPLRQVLILHAEGYSDSQIAVMTKTKLGTVRSRLHYARKRARCYLGKVG